MAYSSGHWYPVLSSSELARRPVARQRFGERWVFWRDARGRAVCMEDRCAHRGAALSQGRVVDGAIQCPFHGFCFDATGQCTRVPSEGDDWPIPDHFRVRSHAVREQGGYVWAWRGPQCDSLPALPKQPLLDDLIFGEHHYVWNGHYTRCIENVIDYSHLPFVHRRNLGAFIRDPVTRVSVEPFDGGFRFMLLGEKSARQFVEFTYPNLWINKVGKRYFLAATFVPMDDTHTQVYVRWYHALRWPVLRQLADAWGVFSQYLVFKDDLPIVASQQPANVDDAAAEKLVPADAALLAYRKLRRAHQEEHRRAARASGHPHSV